MTTGRIRVSLSTNEIELEGPEEFISKYDDTLGAMLQKIREGKTVPPAEIPNGQPKTLTTQEPGPFGEALHRFSSSANDTDKMLLAGSYAQAASSDNSFATGAASKLLLEQGIKVSNPSQSMTNNLKAKRVFKVGSRYRISQQGQAHLQKLGA